MKSQTKSVNYAGKVSAQRSAGGTGSFAAMNLARAAFEIRRIGKTVEMTIIDPDVVESGNIPVAEDLNRQAISKIGEKRFDDAIKVDPGS